MSGATLRNSYRGIVLIILLLSLMGVLAACGGGGGNTQAVTRPVTWVENSRPWEPYLYTERSATYLQDDARKLGVLK